MKRMLLLAAATLALIACNPNTSKQGAPGSDGALALTCDAFANASAQSLAAAYGADNVVEQTLPGVEGESYTATVVYPNDPTRRLEVVWRDQTAKNAPASVLVAGGDSRWVGAHDLSIGDELASVERTNGRAFELWGFDWDYGGWVSDWKEGAFSPSNGCNIRVRFNQRDAASTSASGDSSFMSDDPAMRAADPTVSAFGLLFTAAP